MSEFHRMITYLYLYEHGTKRHNVGFAKIEKRGGQCLVEIHMKNTGHTSSLAPVYFYATSRGRHPGISLGTMSLPRGSGDFKTILKGEPLADSSYTLDDIRGIFIPLSEEIMFVSQWDDSEFIRKNFVEPKQVQETTKPQTEEKEAAQTNANAAIPQQAGKSADSGLQNINSPDASLPQRHNHANASSTQRQGYADASSTQQQSHQADASLPRQSNSAEASSPQQSHHAGVPPAQQNNSAKASSLQQNNRPGASLPQQTGGTNAASEQHGSADTAFAGQTVSSTRHNSAAASSPQQAGKTDISSPQQADKTDISLQQQAKEPAASSQTNAASSQTNAVSPSPDLSAAEAVPNFRENFQSRNGIPLPSIPKLEPLPENWSLKWEFIMENYPVMTPFAGDEKTLCVRWELKDLRLLPRQYWYLGNNSFLLHGFFNYRYLILGITEKAGKKRWFIGIPGVYQNPERVMATLFGFPEFRNEKSAPVNTGEFGYWYRYLNE